MLFRALDATAAVATVILLVGLLVLAGFEREAPEYLVDAFKLVLVAGLRGSVGLAHEFYNGRNNR